MAMGYSSKLLYVKHFHTRVGKGLPEEEFGLGSEGGADLFLRSVR